ncbi:uncharacterized protein LOC135202899 [Macrobrachium nipponense]|uniref:uncharacterized protein LOC135202899 n=1 Tax=Macrobrachium nipponense TaxID=159736 RepID=UPI0030C7CAD6
MTEALQPLLLAEAITDCDLREAAKQLRKREDVTICRVDKTAAFVLMQTEEYHRKIEEILADTTKFTRITKNPVDNIKRKANRIIETVNATSYALHLPPITGDRNLGYIYRNVKTHKQGSPLRPIISQIPAPTYLLAKKLNTILTLYVPDTYSSKSSAEFLEALRVTPSRRCIASMDVESLFTNVPVNETIQMILDKVYRDPDTPPLNIPEHALRALLDICTKMAPFSDHRGRMYTQIDRVAMGSSLGVLFPNFYTGTVEERVFQNSSKLSMYLRYIDGSFVSADSQVKIEQLRCAFHYHSCLSFTIEHCEDRRLPFLDILVEQQDTRFRTNVYTKPTNLGMCMNRESECP